MKLSTQKIAVGATLAAISAAVQIVHIGWQSPWGMWIDLVAIPWILAFFLYSGKVAFKVSVLGAIIITLVAPTTWLGASMKWLATFPMWFLPWIGQKLMRLKFEDFGKIKIILIFLLSAIFLRGIIIIPANYYYAIPIWTGMTAAKAMEVIPPWIIFILNSIQGILEVTVAWLLVFKMRLKRFAIWE